MASLSSPPSGTVPSGAIALVVSSAPTPTPVSFFALFTPELGAATPLLRVARLLGAIKCDIRLLKNMPAWSMTLRIVLRTDDPNEKSLLLIWTRAQTGVGSKSSYPGKLVYCSQSYLLTASHGRARLGCGGILTSRDRMLMTRSKCIHITFLC